MNKKEKYVEHCFWTDFKDILHILRKLEAWGREKNMETVDVVKRLLPFFFSTKIRLSNECLIAEIGIETAENGQY